MNIIVLVSGNGTNLEALIEAEKAGRFNVQSAHTVTRNAKNCTGHIAAVVSDRKDVYALERARARGIPALIEEPDKNLPIEERRRDLSLRILKIARNYNAAFIVLSGFLSIVQGEILKEYKDRIINLHPALLPKYGGPGMYGENVHKAVLAAGEAESGCTVHLVDEGTDTGPILLQKKVPVLKNDTAESLAERIHLKEHKAIVEATILMLKRLSGKEGV